MSNTKLRSAKFSIHQLVEQMPIQSYASRADMRTMLTRCVKDLHQLGFKVGHVKGIQERHVLALIKHWQAEDKTPATIKNYLSKLRKMAKQLGCPEMIKPSNDDYFIAKRSYVPTYNKAITDIDLAKCEDPYIRLSLEGQKLFGFRREEALKCIVSEAYQGDFLVLKPSWTKGGVGRMIRIRTDEQRQWLSKAQSLVKKGQSLIPINKTYKQHLSHYKAVTAKMGLSQLHGLRHAYAQRRYRELTVFFDKKGQGLIPPIAGGQSFKCLTDEQKSWDRRARHIISRELGHSRIHVTGIYLGN